MRNGVVIIPGVLVRLSWPHVSLGSGVGQVPRSSPFTDTVTAAGMAGAVRVQEPVLPPRSQTPVFSEVGALAG